MTGIPKTHVEDAHKLLADGYVDLFQLTPNDGSGTIYFKNDNEATWQGNLYEGVPIALSGIKKSADGSALQPKLAIGDGTMDLSPFKPLIYDGYLDGGLILHIELLLDHLITNQNIRVERLYRIKRVPQYGMMGVELQLATASDALGFTLPHRQYYPPAFPAVQI